MEPFTLTRQPAKRKRQLKIIPNGVTKQGVLFTGADCLPGQQDLPLAREHKPLPATISVDPAGWWWIDLAGAPDFDAALIGPGIDGQWTYRGEVRESIEGAFETRNQALEFLEAMR